MRKTFIAIVGALATAATFADPRTDANGLAVAHFQETPSLNESSTLHSPPNGAKSGPTSRDEES